MEKELDGIKAVYPEEMPEEEVQAYIHRGKEKYGQHLKEIEILICEDDPNDVELHYDVDRLRFQRLRRITGYLVGDLNRWNNGKRAEEHDRVKHDV